MPSAWDEQNELHPVSVDTTLSKQEPRGAEGWTKRLQARMWLLGLWAARVSGARRRYPQPTMISYSGATGAGPAVGLALKREVVLRLMQGEPAEGPCGGLGLPVWKLERWRERAISMRGTSQPGRGEDDGHHRADRGAAGGDDGVAAGICMRIRRRRSRSTRPRRSSPSAWPASASTCIAASPAPASSARCSVGEGRAIGLRADMDALPFRRAQRLRASLDAARQDARLRPRRAHGDAARRRPLSGRDAARFAAPCASSSSRPRRTRPAAGRWSRTGLFDDFPVDAVYGMHNWPGLPVGQHRRCGRAR